MCTDFVEDFASMYKNDTMFNYPEWHDSYLFDVQRKLYRDNRGAHFHNLNPDPDLKGLAGHPFINSELGKYMDHMKGYDRKAQMSSKKRDLTTKQTHPYWKTLKD